jgi:hypothetical protein
MIYDKLHELVWIEMTWYEKWCETWYMLWHDTRFGRIFYLIWFGMMWNDLAGYYSKKRCDVKWDMWNGKNDKSHDMLNDMKWFDMLFGMIWCDLL